jgi:molecular chaperone HtpG
MSTSNLKAVKFKGAKMSVERLDQEIVIGKDILELVSGAMYVEPLTVLREYIQNAVDGIDEAEAAGLHGGNEKARIDVFVDPLQRTLRIRDNGIGVGKSQFPRRLTAFGASKKRGTSARGFRGIGRLSGLGYCQELIFRSRTEGDAEVSEIVWDNRRFREILRDPHYKNDLNEVVKEVVRLTCYSGAGYPRHFFEVELKGVVRVRNDVLLNADEVGNYLAQVAPVPFDHAFEFGDAIEDFLHEHGVRGSYPIYLIEATGGDAGAKQIFRPFQTSFTIHGGKRDRFTGIDFYVVPGVSEETAAVGWALQHAYRGAIAKSEAIKGFRLRCGNIQVGSDDIAAEAFPEPRFNSWSVGEFHVLTPKIVPNGRRDDFEINAHYLSLQSHLATYAKNVTKTCRDKSKQRNFEKRCEEEFANIQQKLDLLSSRSLPVALRSRLREETASRISQLECSLNSITEKAVRRRVEQKLPQLRAKLEKNLETGKADNTLARFTKSKQDAYRHMIELIFDCTKDQSEAKALIEKVIARLVKSA